ncbi:hypothetical protein [uncultured Erythrobacter sp.]|uniref:hypothetical protein n=1 Tax=uncultured Erythrobacter sp. TaxID=263913 RepID=UPI00263A3D2F|nr:hypothetical protein [uncultured Erythrobacter sp.]
MDRAGGLRFLTVLAALFFSAAATADRDTINWDEVDLAAERRAIENFQRYDQLLQNVGWKLAQANWEFCDRVMPATGLHLQDMASYGSPQIARRALGLSGDFAVQTVAEGSPADLSNSLPSNREIVGLAGINPNEWESQGPFDWRRLARVHDLIDEAVEGYDSITLDFKDNNVAVIASVPVCATRFELMGKGKKALADGRRVVIGIEFPAFQYDEDEFAALLAHELAHNLLSHTAWLDRNKRKRRNVRMTEREADRLIPWLLANAGYDPRAGKRFFEKWGPNADGGLFRNRSHDGWDERAEFVEAEIHQIEALIVQHDKADWRTHFQREIDPHQGLENGQR